MTTRTIFSHSRSEKISLFPKLFWATVRETWSCDWEKLFKFEVVLNISKVITRTILSFHRIQVILGPQSSSDKKFKRMAIRLPILAREKNQLRLVSNVSHLIFFYLFFRCWISSNIIKLLINGGLNIVNGEKFVKMIVEMIQTPWNLAWNTFMLVQFFKSVICQNYTEKVWKENIA